MVRREATVAIIIAAACGLGAPRARAAASGLHCDASALRASVGGQPAIEPVTTGRSGDCTTAQATPAVTLPSLLSAGALIASTTADAAGPSGGATGGIAQLRVVPTPDLVAQLPTEQAIDALPTPTVAIPAPLSTALALAGLPTSLTLDVAPAVRALVPAPGTTLLSADVLTARAAVACSGGTASLTGSSEIAGVKLLGQAVGVTGVLDQALTLIDTQHISASQLDVGKVRILTPLDGISAALLAQVRSALAPLVAALPPISLPASVVMARLTPGEQLRDATTLTQRALHAQLTLLGQPVLDAVLGEATVGAAAGACALPPAPVAPAATPVNAVAPAPTTAQGSVTQQLLACSDRKLVLVDVLREGSRVRLLGAANRDYVGRRVAIRLRATGRIVAHAVVRRDGSFQTTAPMPPRAMLATHRRANGVRYRAEIGRELSLPLKLQRRMIVSSLRSSGGRVTITGRVVRPLTTPVAKIRVVRRVSCHKVALVGRFAPRRDGTFPAPAGQSAAVYRLATSVREKPGNPRAYPTFSLPRGVALNTR